MLGSSQCPTYKLLVNRCFTVCPEHHYFTCECCSVPHLTNVFVLQKRPRDFCWAKEGDVLPLIEHLEQLQVSFRTEHETMTACTTSIAKAHVRFPASLIESCDSDHRTLPVLLSFATPELQARLRMHRHCRFTMLVTHDMHCMHQNVCMLLKVGICHVTV